MDALTCDRCGPAVTAHWLWLTDTAELTTCAHHGRQHWEALRRAGFQPYRLDVPDVPPMVGRAQSRG